MGTGTLCFCWQTTALCCPAWSDGGAGGGRAGRAGFVGQSCSRNTVRTSPERGTSCPRRLIGFMQDLFSDAMLLAAWQAVATESQARLRHDKGQLEEHVRQARNSAESMLASPSCCSGRDLKVIDTFNMAVASIEKEKAKLESDLKNADMKLLVLYEEMHMS